MKLVRGQKPNLALPLHPQQVWPSGALLCTEPEGVARVGSDLRGPRSPGVHPDSTSSAQMGSLFWYLVSLQLDK